MKLAVTLGLSDVDHLLNTLTSRQWIEWQRFYRVEPFGPQEQDIHLAALRTDIANYLRPKHHAGYKTADFLRSYTPPEPEKSVEAMWALFS